jgi:hypothetical protein
MPPYGSMIRLFICLLLVANVLAENLPDAPSTFLQRRSPVSAHSAGRSNAQRVWTRKFLAAHGILLASGIYDAEVTHQGLAHHRCVEKNFGNPYPSRGKSYRDALLPIAAVTAADWAMAKLRIPILPYTLMPAGLSVVHFQSGSQWFTHDCW